MRISISTGAQSTPPMLFENGNTARSTISAISTDAITTNDLGNFFLSSSFSFPFKPFHSHPKSIFIYPASRQDPFRTLADYQSLKIIFLFR